MARVVQYVCAALRQRLAAKAEAAPTAQRLCHFCSPLLQPQITLIKQEKVACLAGAGQAWHESSGGMHVAAGGKGAASAVSAVSQAQRW